MSLFLTNPSLKINILSRQENILSNWLKANKISLNTGKTQLILFNDSEKQLSRESKIKLTKLNESDLVKYFGIEIDKNLTW